MARINEWDKKHQRNITAYERQIDEVFRTATREAAMLAAVAGVISPDKPFSFDDYPVTRKRLEKLLSGLKNRLSAVIVNGINSEWTLANNKNSELANRVFGDYVGKLSEEQYRKYYSTNDNARNAFIGRKEAGMNLSDRVWKYTEQFKSEIELGIDIGLRDGLSADELSRDLRQYLQHPDKLFRRVRDEHGNLVLSKAAAAYHPGQGVYRSSYKNARRLAATETNMAYRTADFERWQQLDFIVGIEIRLSNNHTLNGQPFEDICDFLKGRYPKDFKFVGWHPHCRCHVVTILKSDEEIAEDNRRILAGKEPTEDSVNTVRDVPKSFKGWLEDNRERAKRSYSMPYFLKDNPQYLPKDYLSLYAMKTPYKTFAEYGEAMKFNKKYAAFTPAQQANNRELSKALPVLQGKVMNFTEADGGKANPNYSLKDARAQGYYDNCQTCTVSYELRRRGFNIEALPNKDNEFYKEWCVQNKFKWQDRFLNADGTRPTYTRSGYDIKDSIKSKQEFIENATKEIGRYEVYCTWKGKQRSGHVFIVERQNDGNLLWFDPQTGEHGGAFKRYLDRMKKFNIGVLRIDDKIINPKFAERFKRLSK